MRGLYKFFLLLWLLFSGSWIYAQEKGSIAVDSMVRLLSVAKADTNKVNLLYRLTLAYDGSDQNKALAYAQQSYMLAKKLGWKKGQLNSLTYIGSLQMDMGKNEQALASYQQLYQLSLKIGNPADMAKSLINIGAVYQRSSKYAEAADYFFKGLRVAEQHQNETLIAKSESNIASLFIQQRDFEKAKLHAGKAEARYQRLQEPGYRAKNLEILGDAFAFDGRYKQAIPVYLRSLKLYQQVGDQLGLATVYTQMVDCYSNDPLKRIEYLRQAKRLWDKLAPLNLNAIANTGNFGYSYFDILKNPTMLKLVQDSLGLTKAQLLLDADHYLKEGIRLSQQAGVPDLVSQLTSVYAELCEYKGDYKDALINFKLHYSIQDSIASQTIKNKIAKLEAEKEIVLRDRKLQRAQLQMERIWTYVVTALLVVVVLAAYVFNRSRISRLRLKNELIKQQAEEQTRELLYRNKLSESELKAIRAQMNPHFIFNVLNSIESYIVDNDARTASRLVQKFASLSRLILENSTQSLVSADREWKALNLYTELEAMRFSGQFTYRFEVDAQIDLGKILLPPMLVQPLIENAIHHGLRHGAADNSELIITLEQARTQIRFTVSDNGVGIDESKSSGSFTAIKSKSIGLSAIRERIEIFNMMYGDQPASFMIRKKTPEEGAGTIAELLLPKFSGLR
ncbi:histidine kinase [Mucilaginibacter auburnensis]|uniref:Tetratricopeptide repeat protein n=1 Tax=Mucilaginibacter auburnensis TaxID=1457233 RepID=A0A2H9VNU6_9SPHI|nr:histidine kinase [Mucilaginibacter auburnensis]PJJ80019.1 tetratricopeptide repeat protein [Mucilaginibacter auburnensis]